MPDGALRQLTALAGLAASEIGSVNITGADPVLPTPYRVGTAGAAALAATGVAVSHLWRLKTGRQQDVSVDLRAAAISLRSNTYLRINGEKPPPAWDPLSGFYATAEDGWIQLHCNFRPHRDAALRVLGATADRAAIQGACESWQGEALEEAIMAAGGCTGFVRTADAWTRHPQAAAVGSQALLEIGRIGDAPPQPLPPGDQPLSGVRVLDLTRVLAGPTCARTLAEHGADVIKITAEHLPDSGAIEYDTGLGKLSSRLDLRRSEDLSILRALAQGADIFSQSYRPGALAERGLSPENLAELRPGLVYVTLSGWGHSGPWRSRRGFDSVVQSVSGMAYQSGDGAKPRLMPVSAIDYVSGYLMAFGAMVALGRRAVVGGSWLVRVSLARTGQWIVSRGLVDPLSLVGVPVDLTREELDHLTMETPSPMGLVRHLRPVVKLSETPPRWSRPPVPLGYDAPVWPTR